MTKEATKLKMLDIHSPAEEVLAALINERFAQKNTRKYKNKWQEKGESRESLLEFMNGPVVAERFARKWLSETDSKWTNRTFNDALWQTTGHTLAAISGDAQNFLDVDAIENFPGHNKEQVERILTQSQLLLDFFRQIIAT